MVSIGCFKIPNATAATPEVVLVAAQLKAGAGTIVLFWLAICMGLFAGAAVGFEADTAANTTVEYDADTGEFIAGDNTTNVLDGEADDDAALESDRRLLNARGESTADDVDDFIQETEKNIEEYDAGLLPDALEESIEQYNMRLVNATVDQIFSIVAGVADPTADVVYENQTSLNEDAVYLGIQVLMIAPFALLIYGMIRRLR